MFPCESYKLFSEAIFLELRLRLLVVLFFPTRLLFFELTMSDRSTNQNCKDLVIEKFGLLIFSCFCF